MNSIDGFEKIIPDAKLDDDNFSLIIVKTASVFEIVYLVALMVGSRKHVKDRQITEMTKLYKENIDWMQRSLVWESIDSK